ncbi:MAG: helix-hairpin-helix domain-containing protein [Deltaproteobacteria bacterium]|nr:helix-hairpin-helix domain-containing protein [Deltaproteobacteria bacterium]
MVKKRLVIGLCVVLVALLAFPGFLVAGDKININTASKEQLTELKGIGPVTADRIIEYREKNGKFETVEELTEVKGIGDGTLMVIKEFIVVE